MTRVPPAVQEWMDLTPAEREHLRDHLPCTQRDGVCRQHGSPWQGDRCATQGVLEDIRAERTRQFRRYGTNEALEDGTGPDVEWLQGVDSWATALSLEADFREIYESYEAQHGAPTWRHLVLEEVAEAFAEADPTRLEAELIQVAALCASWVEKLRARRTS